MTECMYICTHIYIHSVSLSLSIYIYNIIRCIYARYCACAQSVRPKRINPTKTQNKPPGAVQCISDLPSVTNIQKLENRLVVEGMSQGVNTNSALLLYCPQKVLQPRKQPSVSQSCMASDSVEHTEPRALPVLPPTRPYP